MRAEERDAAYLWDMLQAARDATATVAGIDEQQLQRDRMRMLALERSMELIGEAARLSPGAGSTVSVSTTSGGFALCGIAPGRSKLKSSTITDR